jgi:hypothetical protein
MADQDHRAGAIPQRPLGRTGVKVSARRLGGHHLGDLKTVAVSIYRMSTDILPDIDISAVSAVWQYTGMLADEIKTRIVVRYRNQQGRNPVVLGRASVFGVPTSCANKEIPCRTSSVETF